MARPEKAAAVKDISERLTKADAALLTEYRGLTVSEIAELRRSLREADAEYRVLKNTLARIAVREVGLEDLVELLVGPTAIAFVHGDPAAAAKALDDAAKKFPVLVIKGGVLSGKVIDADKARELAKLEPRDVLLAKIAMMLNQPAQLTVNVLAALLRDLGSMLAQVVIQKEAEAPAAQEAEAPAAQEAEAPAAQTTDADEAPAQDETPAPDEAPGAPEEVPGEPDDSPGDDDAEQAQASAEDPEQSDADSAPAEDPAVEAAVEESAGLTETESTNPVATEAAQEDAAGTADTGDESEGAPKGTDDKEA